ncbi:MAG: hypothetical protein JNL25_11430 [Rhodospirillaceae bacterium]|nr:hypothetical protein [Rhodospirillaceae bacterium]
MPTHSRRHGGSRLTLAAILLVLAAAPASAWDRRHNNNPYGYDPHGSGIWSWQQPAPYVHTVPVPLWSHDSHGWQRRMVPYWQQPHWQQPHHGWHQNQWQPNYRQRNQAPRHYQGEGLFQQRPGSAYYYQGGRIQLWP